MHAGLSPDPDAYETAKHSPRRPEVRAGVPNVEQAKHLPPWSAEIHLLASRVPELANPGSPQCGVQPVQLRRPELDPLSSKGGFIVDRAMSDIGGREPGEFDAEATSVIEGDEQDQIFESEIELAHESS